MRGRPGWFVWVHFLVIRRRCQDSRVAGVDEAVAAQFAGQEPGQGGQDGSVRPGRAGWAELPA